jgi:hypothetical protein
MSDHRSSFLFRAGSLLVLLLVLLSWSAADCDAKRDRKKQAPVWVVFFFSKDCPRCASVSRFIKILRKRYPVRLKKVNIDQPRDYALFERLEAIHSEERFAVPLVMVGQAILMGEDEIMGKLESIVRRLARSGGASLPYLGPKGKNALDRVLRPTKPEPRCEGRGRPPTIGEEWAKIKSFFRGLFWKSSLK